jgi:hypothetical protein
MRYVEYDLIYNIRTREHGKVLQSRRPRCFVLPSPPPLPPLPPPITYERRESLDQSTSIITRQRTGMLLRPTRLAHARADAHAQVIEVTKKRRVSEHALVLTTEFNYNLRIHDGSGSPTRSRAMTTPRSPRSSSSGSCRLRAGPTSSRSKPSTYTTPTISSRTCRTIAGLREAHPRVPDRQERMGRRRPSRPGDGRATLLGVARRRRSPQRQQGGLPLQPAPHRRQIGSLAPCLLLPSGARARLVVHR